MGGAGVIASTVIRVGLEGKSAFKGLALLDKKMKGLNKPVKAMSNQFKSLLKLAGFAGFTKMAIDAGKFGRAMGILADKTGIAASKISSMRNSFSALGGSAKSIDNLLNNISTGLARLSMGDGAMAATLSSMNISAWDENGRLKKADRLQGEISNWANQQKALGRSFAEVAVFLKDNFGIEEDLAKQMYSLGHKGMEAQRKATEAKTGKLEDGEISNLQKLNTAFSTLIVTIQVLIQKIIAGLSPVIEYVIDVLQSITSIISDSFKYLFDKFKEGGDGVEEFAIVLKTLKGIFVFLGWVLKGVIDVAKGVWNAFVMVIEAAGRFVAWVQDKLGIRTKHQEKINEIGEKVRSGEISREEAAKELAKLMKDPNSKEKTGGFESVNKVFNEIIGPVDLSKRKTIKRVIEENIKGNISDELLEEILTAEGISLQKAKAIYSGDIDKWQDELRKGKMSLDEYQNKIGYVHPYETIVIENVEKAIPPDYEMPAEPIYMEQTITVNKDGTVNTETTSSGNINFLTDKLILNEDGG